MDKIYDFEWLVREIDDTLFLIAGDGKEVIGNYQANDILLETLDDALVKFANIQDLTNFINYGIIRFVNSENEDDFIDVPIINILLLYKDTNELGKKDKIIKIEELRTYMRHNDQIISYGYIIYPYKIGKLSEDGMAILKIANSFDSLSMNEKIGALQKINLINYQKTKSYESLKR